MKYSEVKLIYTSPAFMPEGVYMDKIYHIIKKEDKFCFTDGISEFEGEEEFIKMLFSPQDEKVKWEDVDFKDEVKFVKTLDKK